MQYPFHDVAKRLVTEIPNFSRSSILELGCGDGVLLEWLRQQGADARGTVYRDRGDDYIREREHPETLPVDYGIDLNKPLPYPDGSFDIVYSTEVIEHVEGQRNFVLEAARVLKPGGHLILTTPNVYRLTSRLKFAFTGFPVINRQLCPWSTSANHLEEYHQRVPDFPVLHFLLWRGGLRIERMGVSDLKTAEVLLTPLYPAVKLGTALLSKRRRYDSDEDYRGRADLGRWLGSPAMAYSAQICLRARKQDTAAKP